MKIQTIPPVARPSADVLPPAIATGGGGDFVRLDQVITTGSQSTITFSSISGAYTNLLIVLYGRGSSGARIQNWIKFNNDSTAANYDRNQYIIGTNTTVAAGIISTSTKGLQVGDFVGDDTDADAISCVEIQIASYASTAFHKSVLSASCALAGATTNCDVILHGGKWKSTSAITQIDFVIDAGNYIDGTTATLYGMT